MHKSTLCLRTFEPRPLFNHTWVTGAMDPDVNKLLLKFPELVIVGTGKALRVSLPSLECISWWCFIVEGVVSLDRLRESDCSRLIVHIVS